MDRDIKRTEELTKYDWPEFYGNPLILAIGGQWNQSWSGGAIATLLAYIN